MSAFIVSHKHIDALISAGMPERGNVLRWRIGPEPEWTGQANANAYFVAVQVNTRELRHDTADLIGAMLWNENRRSVDHRYDEANDREVYEYPIFTKRLKPVEILKAIACYEYQSCEHPEWKDSEAARFCEALRHRMIQLLPGYEGAPVGGQVIIDRGAILCRCGHPDGEHAVTGECAVERAGLDIECGCQKFLPLGGDLVAGRTYFESSAITSLEHDWGAPDDIMVCYEDLYGHPEYAWVTRDTLARLIFRKTW